MGTDALRALNAPFANHLLAKHMTMFKKATAQPLALGLAALLLGTQPVLAAETIDLVGPGNSVRSFTLDEQHVLQLAGEDSPRTRVRKASNTEQKALKRLKGVDGRGGLETGQGSASVSPVLRDAAGRAFGLPGGLIVTFKEDVDEDEARTRLQAAGLVPQHQITPGIWAVESPAGLETIEMANKANASGEFADVSPNWWTKRALK